jgi:hypothetical protein
MLILNHNIVFLSSKDYFERFEAINMKRLKVKVLVYVLASSWLGEH